MVDFILEIYSEEIPATQLQYGSQELLTAITTLLKSNNLKYKDCHTYYSPRRLSVIIDNLDIVIPQQTIEIKGPRIDATEQAISGFLLSHNAKKEDLIIKNISGKECYFLNIIVEEKSTKSLLKENLPLILANFPWKKNMRWGNYNIRWVRPINNILCTLDDEIVEFDFGHIRSNNYSFGHFFMDHTRFIVTSSDQYKFELEQKKVVWNQETRKQMIAGQIKELAEQNKLKIIEDNTLLNEVSGLVEFPNALIGIIDEKYMILPREILITSMRLHQKYFCLEDANGKISNHFITIANIKTDNDQIIINGNQKVLSARLEDALFFWNKDLEQHLENNIEKLKNITFHQKLGNIYQKSQRIKSIANYIANFVDNIDLELLNRSATLCKTDLVTDMVGEFPELQGVIGKFYALAHGENNIVAEAIAEHYLPMSQLGTCPESKISTLISIADKIDSLIGLWIAGEKPTGSKDPFALRRAALGIIKLLIHSEISISIDSLIENVLSVYKEQNIEINNSLNYITEIKEFILNRFAVFMKGLNIAHDVVMSVTTNFNDIYLDNLKIIALFDLLQSSEGTILLQSYVRASNIVSVEEKKDQITYNGAVDIELLQQIEEKELYESILYIYDIVHKDLDKNNYVEAMQQIKKLVDPINNFFDKVTVNDNNIDLRKNRLNILAKVRNLLNEIADFSILEL